MIASVGDAEPGRLREPSLADALIPLVAARRGLGATLGVSTLLYAPYAVFCFASPFLRVLYGFTGFRIETIEPSDTAKELR